MAEELASVAVGEVAVSAEEAKREEMEYDFLLRAEEVLKPQVYIGYFEFLVWSHVEGRPVHILIGDEVLDVSAVFGGGLGLATDGPPIYGIAVVWDHGFHRWCVDTSPHFSRANHFLIGVSAPPPLEDYVGLPAQTAEVAASKKGVQKKQRLLLYLR